MLRQPVQVTKTNTVTGFWHTTAKRGKGYVTARDLRDLVADLNRAGIEDDAELSFDNGSYTMPSLIGFQLNHVESRKTKTLLEIPNA